MQITGICRFSYLATRGWKKTAAHDVDETAAVLFASERMDRRFELFEGLCLPSIAAQTDTDFKLVLLTAGSLPPEWRARLEAAVEPYPNIVVHRIRPRLMPEAVTMALRRTVAADGPPVVQFCLDDDDALSVNYVARLREMAGAVLASRLAEQLPVALNVPRGLSIGDRGDGFVLSETFAPYLALGLAVVTGPDIPINAYTWPHRRVPTRMVALSDPGPMSWINGLHGHHDSAGLVKGRSHGVSPEKLSGYIAEEFPFLTEDRVTLAFGDEAVRAFKAAGSSSG
jgi:hypothetical protein